MDSHNLDEVFSEEEIWTVIKDIPADQAPGPDGFIGLLFTKSWPIIKGDVIAPIRKFFLCNGRGFGRLNQALVTLIPKKPDACLVGDFRPISLMHNIPKICAKLMASKLALHMPDLVQINQSAFIRWRSIDEISC